MWHVAQMWLFHLFLCYIIFLVSFRFSKRITWEINTINWKFSLNFIKMIKLSKSTNFSFSFKFIIFDSFLVFWNNFKLKYVSSWLLDQCLLPVSFSFSESSYCTYLQITECYFLLLKKISCLFFDLFHFW